MIALLTLPRGPAPAEAEPAFGIVIRPGPPPREETGSGARPPIARTSSSP